MIIIFFIVLFLINVFSPYRERRETPKQKHSLRQKKTYPYIKDCPNFSMFRRCIFLIDSDTILLVFSENQAKWRSISANYTPTWNVCASSSLASTFSGRWLHSWHSSLYGCGCVKDFESYRPCRLETRKTHPIHYSIVYNPDHNSHCPRKTNIL